MSKKRFINQKPNTLKAKKIHKMPRIQKPFPIELFDELLAMAEPQERLIYLLFGACGARVKEVLDLRISDIDIANKDIWVHKYGGFPRKLTWINGDTYKSMFFDTVFEYQKLKGFKSIHAKSPQDTFFFTSNKQTKVSAATIHFRFKKQLKILVEKHKGYEKLTELCLYSFRYMFILNMLEMDMPREILICKLGHSPYSIEQTMRYMNSINLRQKLYPDLMD